MVPIPKFLTPKKTLSAKERGSDKASPIEGVDGVAKKNTVIAVHALLLTLSKYASGAHAASFFIAD